MGLGIYIHIPFCRRKCRYCDFPSFTGLDYLAAPYVDALIREIRQSGLAGAEVDTVYIGGGTPTLLPAGKLGRILAALRQTFDVKADAEITIEANPGTVDEAKLAALRAQGINRISFGVQSFEDRILAALGRLHTSAQAADAVWLARQAGFGNISLDLMYGLPGQSLADFQASLDAAVSLGVEHISAYGLTIEEDTPFGRDFRAGLLNLPDQDEEAAMYDLKVRFLTAQGYRRYEISNYAKQGFACRHNLKYWRYVPYVGFGAGACSFTENERRTNTADIFKYISLLEDGQPPTADREKIDFSTAVAEYVFLALRTAEGMDLSRFKRRFKLEFANYYQDAIGRLIPAGLIKFAGGRVFLTEKGMKFGNTVACAFLPDKA